MTKTNQRVASISRETKETIISVTLDLDGTGDAIINTQVPFFSHMLQMLAKHGRINLNMSATGDLDHHVIEDAAIVLGKAIREALGDMTGIRRFGDRHLAMDETLARCVIDISGRSCLVRDLQLHGLDIEGMKIEDIDHFLLTFTQNLKANIHVHVLYGENDHHKVEAAIKAMALAIRMAKEMDPLAAGEVPSTKGMLDAGD